MQPIDQSIKQSTKTALNNAPMRRHGTSHYEDLVSDWLMSNASQGTLRDGRRLFLNKKCHVNHITRHFVTISVRKTCLRSGFAISWQTQIHKRCLETFTSAADHRTESMNCVYD